MKLINNTGFFLQGTPIEGKYVLGWTPKISWEEMLISGIINY